MGEVARMEQVYKRVRDGQQTLDILSDVSLMIHSGEFVAIMGRSGSGKSTLLNILGLLDQPSFGAVQLCGQPTWNATETQQADFRRRYIGFIFQHYHLFPHLTVLQNVMLPMAYARIEDRVERGSKFLDQLGLGGKADVFPSILSGGERQRVAIARALANSPALILADEPTGALDGQSGECVMEMLQQAQQHGTAVVVVTHDEKIARQAQRMLVMREGRLEAA